METYKDIPEFEGLYQINNQGIIKRVTSSYGNLKYLKDKPLSTRVGKGGFLFTVLRKAGKMKTVCPHRIVAELFVPNPDSKPFPKFKDGNKLNISADNLEWGYRTETSEGLKRGDKREDGKIFIRYSKRKDKRLLEVWGTEKQFKSFMDKKKGDHRKYKTVYRREWYTTLLDNARRSSLERGHLAPTIDVEWIKQKFENQQGKCYWLQIPLIPTQREKKLTQPSLDRLDNSIGYTPENTVISCLFANRGRGACSVEEMEQIKQSILSLEDQIIKDLKLL